MKVEVAAKITADEYKSYLETTIKNHGFSNAVAATVSAFVKKNDHQLDDNKYKVLLNEMVRAAKISHYLPPEVQRPYTAEIVSIKKYLSHLNVFDKISTNGLSSLTLNEIELIKKELIKFYADYKVELDACEKQLTLIADTNTEKKSDAKLLASFSSSIFQDKSTSSEMKSAEIVSTIRHSP